MGTTYTCTCEATGNYEYCSCGCNTCQDLCSTCPTWYWFVLGAGVLLGIILGIIGFMRRRRNRRLMNKPLTINLNPVQVGPGQPNQMPQQVQQQPRPQPQQAQQRPPQQAQQAQPRQQPQQPRQQPQPQQYQQMQQAQPTAKP